MAGVNSPNTLPRVGMNATDSQVVMPGRGNAGYTRNGGSVIRVNTPPTPVNVNPINDANMGDVQRGRGAPPAVRDSMPIQGLSEHSGPSGELNPDPASITTYQRQESRQQDYRQPVEVAPQSLNPLPEGGDALMAAAGLRDGTPLQYGIGFAGQGAAPYERKKGVPVREMGGLETYGGR